MLREQRIKREELRLRGKELNLRQWEAKFKAKVEATENGIKGLVLINGGAAVALGALLQAIVSKPEAAPLLHYVLWGISFNVLGVAIASAIFWLRYMQQRLEARTNKFMEANGWWRGVWVAALFSIIFFVLGLGYVVYGGLTQLSPVKQQPVVLPAAADNQSLSACMRSLSAADCDSIHRGLYTYGAEVDAFRPCGSEKEYWVNVTPWVREPLAGFLKERKATEPYQPVYIEFRGHILNDKRDGFAAQYDGLIHISEVLVISEPSDKQCRG